MKRVLLVAAVLMLFGSACTDATKEAPLSSPQAAPKPTTKFTTVPEGCELLDRETIAKYAPSGLCKRGHLDDERTNNSEQEPITRRGPRWEPSAGRRGQFYAVVDVDLRLNLDTYTEDQESASRSTSGVIGSSQRPVAGVGDKAHLYYLAGDGQGKYLSRTTGVLVSRWGNVSLRVIYWHYQANKSDDSLSEQNVMKALKAITRDIYDDLS